MVETVKATHFRVTNIQTHVAHVVINRPTKLNAFQPSMWQELRCIFDALSGDSQTRAVLFSGSGPAFTAGLDIATAAQQSFFKPPAKGATLDVARRSIELRRYIEDFQECVNSIERCEKPVICILHGICYGLAIDLACCADIRICSEDAQMAVKEVDIGLAADIGTLARLPRITSSSSWVKDICLTARTFTPAEALQYGFVSHVLSTKDRAIERALKLALEIAQKSDIAVTGTKAILNHARDHDVQESLRFTAVWNASMVQSRDVSLAMSGALRGGKSRDIKL